MNSLTLNYHSRFVSPFALLQTSPGIIYLAIEAVPIVYAAHGFHDPGVEFMFFSIVVGYIIAIAIFPFQWRLNQQLNKRNGGTVIPEGKLYWGFLAGIIFPISLYLFAWLGLPKIFWFASLVPLALFGVASHILVSPPSSSVAACLEEEI